MRLTVCLGRTLLTLSLVAALAVPALAAIPAPATRTRRTRAASRSSLARRPAAHSKLSAQRTIDDDRAAQIQAALIRAGYLSGAPSGHWDTDSIAAMTKLQADNGWQTKLVPDSRALIKLGLGPAGTPSSTPATDSSASIAATPTTTASR